jgi:flagellum-specific peptidoglycan hydrolase FlgJ
MIQYKLRENEDYYKFLTRIGYAEDPEYINKVKSIVKRNDKRRSE